VEETGEIADAITACVVETMNTSTEVAESTSFYVSGMENVWIGLITIFVLIIIFRLGILFVDYIRTGGIGDFEEDSFVYNLFEGHLKDVAPALVFGTFPGAILIDMFGFIVITVVAGLIWAALAIILPLIGLAYLIRLPIARKQEFIGRLDGTYDDDPDCRNGGS